MTDWTDLKRLAEEATPGPWEIQVAHYPESGDMIVTTDPNGWELLEVREDCPDHEANAAFIAAANPKTILALIAENEALRKRARISEREAGKSLSMLKGLEKVARVVDANSDDVCGENNKLRAEVEALRKDAELLDKLEKTVKIGSRSVSPHDDDSWQGIYAFRTQLQGRSIRDALWSAIENEPAYMDYVRELNRK